MNYTTQTTMRPAQQFRELANSQLWKALQDQFAKEWNAPLLLLDRDGNTLLLSGKLPSLYALLAKKIDEKERIKDFISMISEGSIFESATGVFHIFQPVYLNHAFAGVLCIAYLRDDQNKEQFFSQLSQQVHIPKEDLIEVYEELPVQSPEQIQSLKKVAATLSNLFPLIAQSDAQSLQEISHLQSLQHVHSLAESLDLSIILEKLLNLLVSSYHLLNAAILLPHEKKKYYHHQDDLIPYALIEEVLLFHVEKNKHLLIVQNAQQDILFQHIALEVPFSFLAVPLIMHNQVQSIVILYHFEKIWNEKRVEEVQSILEEAKKAIEKSLQFSSVQSDADHDSLTKLYNRAYFMYALQNVLQHSFDEKQSTSLLMLDIDDFKKLNDTQGHQKGDEVLKHISALLQQTIRKSDIPCRYGGEEFVVILPSARHDEARQIAERIREHIAITPYAGISLTASMGVASSLNSSSLPGELIKAADECMYSAKASGKNCVRSSFIVDRSLGTVQVEKVNEMYVRK